MPHLPITEHLQPLEARRLLSLTPGPELTVTGGAAGGSVGVAVAGDGTYLVATELVRGSVSEVTAFRYTTSGQPIGSPIRLYTYLAPAAHLQRNARIDAAMDADGDAIVAYGLTDQHRSGVYFNRFDRTGALLRPTVRIDNINGTLTRPSVTMDAGGGFVIAWVGHADNEFNAQAFDAFGGQVAGRILLRADPVASTHKAIDIALRPDGAGAAFAAGVAQPPGSIAYGRANRSDVLGEVKELTEPFDLRAPSVAIHADGSFIVGYERVDPANPAARGLYVQRFTAAGDAAGQPMQLGASLPSGGSGAHSISLDDAPEGGFVASFVQTVGAVDTIYAARFDAAGALDESGYVPVATDAAAVGSDPRFRPQIAADAGGSAVVGYVMRTSGEVRRRRLAAHGSGGELRGSELFVEGTIADDHIIVERVRQNLFVNLNGVVERFDAGAVRFLSISSGGGDDDVINASAIPSTIHGGDGFDTLWGGSGPDRLRGFGGNDVLRGGDGDDVLLGDNGDDVLRGGAGTDTLTGRAGLDALGGGEVTDPLPPGLSFAGGVVRFDGTDAPDTVSVSRLGSVVIVRANDVSTAFPLDDLTRFELIGRGARDVLTFDSLGIRKPTLIDGGDGDDALRSGDGFDTIIGGDGHDHLIGGRGEDFLEGGDDDDTLEGESANDTLLGGADNDELHGGGEDNWVDGGLGNDSINGGGGVNTLDYASRTNGIRLVRGEGSLGEHTAQGGEFGENDRIAHIARIFGTPGDDFIAFGHTVFGGGGDDTLVGGRFDEQLFGEGGNDDLDGGAGTDYLEGGAGDDVLRSTDAINPRPTFPNGIDSLFGLAGNDTFFTDDGAGDTVRGGPGDDSADADDADDVLAVETVG